jgi:mannose-6-phosphate isomerase-like protein (cupin superfamily)
MSAGRFPYQVEGPERERALSACHAVLRGWGLTMPAVEPLALDFGLGRFAEIGETEFWVANEAVAGYCGKFLFVQDGQTCPTHKHKVKHETFFVLKGSVQMEIDGQVRTLAQGDCLVMPPGQLHRFTGIGPALLLECSMPSIPGDSYFTDPAIGANGVL